MAQERMGQNQAKEKPDGQPSGFTAVRKLGLYELVEKTLAKVMKNSVNGKVFSKKGKVF
jgi:hypothetical protein